MHLNGAQFFTSLSSKSSGTGTESDSFIDKTFTFLKQNEHLKIKTEHFKFVHVTENLVEKLINNMNVSSGAGLSVHNNAYVWL